MKKLVQKASLALGSTVGSLQLFATQAYAQNQINLLGESGELQKPKGFATDIGSVINAVLSFVLVIAALLVLMYLIWGGIEWITSGGDKGKTESARNKITAAVIGLIILAAAYAIFTLAINFLGFGNVNEVFNVNTIQ